MSESKSVKSKGPVGRGTKEGPPGVKGGISKRGVKGGKLGGAGSGAGGLNKEGAVFPYNSSLHAFKKRLLN